MLDHLLFKRIVEALRHPADTSAHDGHALIGDVESAFADSEEVRECLAQVVSYHDENGERLHYDEHVGSGGDPQEHVYYWVEPLRKYLKPGPQGAPNHRRSHPMDDRG